MELHQEERGLICYKSKYHSTQQYAEWIAEATGLPLVDLARSEPPLEDYDYYLIGSPVYIGRLYLRKWLDRHWEALSSKPTLLFTVSGTRGDHPNWKTYMETSLSPEMRKHLTIVPLRGRLSHEALPWWLSKMLKWVGRHQEEAEERERMVHGFDFVDREQVKPIRDWVEERELVTG